MTLTLELSPELEETLRSTAERHGLAPDQYVLDVIQERLERDRHLPPHLTRSEAELLQRINEGLPPSTWTRYQNLKAKRDAETLTPEEHAELIQLVNEVEGWNVRRLELVAELAKRRGVRLPDLWQELGLGPPAHARAWRHCPRAPARGGTGQWEVRVLSFSCCLLPGPIQR